MLQMLRKSVETRDWLNTIEPRNVRAVMKRVVEDMTAIDLQVMLLSASCFSFPSVHFAGLCVVPIYSEDSHTIAVFPSCRSMCCTNPQ